jgi:sRNA-binding regulator protein Hfq
MEDRFPMDHTFLPTDRAAMTGRLAPYTRKNLSLSQPFRFPVHNVARENENCQAELFYLQKQIQTLTPMVVVLEDGERLEGCIEWYDRNSLKLRGKTKSLIYKSAIKFMYKLSDNG